jgi:hypothetical protein
MSAEYAGLLSARATAGRSVTRLALAACALILMLSEAGTVSAQPTTLYVSLEGDDTWTGALSEPNADRSDGPVATLEAARDALRGVSRTDGATVIVRGGTYARSETFELASPDSGADGAPVVYRAADRETVRIVGGSQVADFAAVTDASILARLMPEARDHVVQADLRALGMDDFGSPGGGGLELFFNGEPMTPARWPNEGFVRVTDLVGGDPVDVRGTKGDKTGKFMYDGDRPSRWTDENDPWVHGYWFWDWSDQRHRVESIDVEKSVIAVEPPYHNYGYRVGQWFYAFNLLAELDTPGEWYLDREAGILYFWPPTPIADGEALVSGIDTIISAHDTEHVEFRGLTLEACRGTAVEVTGGEGVRVVGCSIRNTGSWAVRINGGAANGVVGCDITGTGGGGVSLSGGDRLTLTASGHYADNNHIHHYSRWSRMYNPAITMNGVGQRATHNLIDNAPHMAIGFSGNDHLMEFNEIHSVCYESNDAGAIYAGRDWTMRGTVIRHNYMHHVNGFEAKGCVGVYLDDMFSGTEIVGNVFYKVTRAAFIGGGRDCLVENNMFVDCKPALHIDNRAMGWAGYHVATTMKDRLDDMPFRDPVWAERYPELLTVWEDEPAAPKGNVVARNVSFGGKWDGVQDGARGYVTFEGNLIDEDPRFQGTPPADFRLREDSPAFGLGFKSIPVGRIGLYASEERASWPVEHVVREKPAEVGD